ncbi:MAG: SOS response-associated peptidase [Pseudomonadota bacterium]
MCGRFAVGDMAGSDWVDWLEVEVEQGWPPPDWPSANWNVAPTQPVGFVVEEAGHRCVMTGRWGLIPHWWKKPLAEFRATTFNARSEEAHGKPMFRDAWKRHRCLIPALGYYEWTGKKGDKTPWFVTSRRNTPGMWFAGLWASAKIGESSIISCTVLTTGAGEATLHLHPRSPVVLSDEEAQAWLRGTSDPKALMHAIPRHLTEVWEVDRAVGKVANNGPELLERVGLGLCFVYTADDYKPKNQFPKAGALPVVLIRIQRLKRAVPSQGA